MSAGVMCKSAADSNKVHLRSLRGLFDDAPWHVRVESGSTSCGSVVLPDGYDIVQRHILRVSPISRYVAQSGNVLLGIYIS